QVVVGTLAHHDGAQAQAVAATGLLDEDARQQTTDATETVEHHVGAFALLAALVGQAVQLFAHEGGQIGATGGLELGDQLAQVDRRGAQVHLAHGLEDGVAVVHGQLVFAAQAVTGEAVRLEDGDHRAVDQAATEDRGHYLVVAVELTDQLNHGLIQCIVYYSHTQPLVGYQRHQ